MSIQNDRAADGRQVRRGVSRQRMRTPSGSTVEVEHRGGDRPELLDVRGAGERWTFHVDPETGVAQLVDATYALPQWMEQLLAQVGVSRVETEG